MSKNQNKSKTTLCFTGDLYLKQRGEIDNLFDQSVLDFLNEGDGCFINYESPLTGFRMAFDKHVPKPRRDRNYSNEDTLDDFLSVFPNGIISLANDHMGDRFAVGIIDTLDRLEKNGIPFIGAGRVKQEVRKYMIIGDDVKVGVISVLGKIYGINKYAHKIGALRNRDPELITKLINEMRQEADYVVLIYHGGRRYNHIAEPRKQRRFRRYLDEGCDVVISHHSHTVQKPEKRGDKYIFYSLGDLYRTEKTDVVDIDPEGAVLKIEFSKDGISCDIKTLNIGEHSVSLSEDSPAFISGEDEYNSEWENEKETSQNNRRAYINYNNRWKREAYQAERDNIERVLGLIETNREAAELEGIEERLMKRFEVLERRIAYIDEKLSLLEALEQDEIVEQDDIEEEEEQEEQDDKEAVADVL